MDGTMTGRRGRPINERGRQILRERWLAKRAAAGEGATAAPGAEGRARAQAAGGNAYGRGGVGQAHNERARRAAALERGGDLPENAVAHGVRGTRPQSPAQADAGSRSRMTPAREPMPPDSASPRGRWWR